MQNFWIKSYLKHSPEINSVYAVYKQLCIQSLISLHNNCRFLCGSFKGNCDSNFFIKIKDEINLNFQDLIFTFQDLIISRVTISFLLVFKLLISSRKQKLITSTFLFINLVSSFYLLQLLLQLFFLIILFFLMMHLYCLYYYDILLFLQWSILVFTVINPVQ